MLREARGEGSVSSEDATDSTLRKSLRTCIAPVFVLVRTQVRNVVVKEGQVETGIEQLVAAMPQQSDSVVFSLPHILLKIEEVQPNTGMQWRPEHERVMARSRFSHSAARINGII